MVGSTLLGIMNKGFNFKKWTFVTLRLINEVWKMQQNQQWKLIDMFPQTKNQYLYTL